MSKSKVSLVTGGAGFIGSHVADHLLKLGHQVIVLDDLSGGYKNNLPQQSIFIKGSIINKQLLEKLFIKYQPDYVFHLAAYAAEGLSHFIRHYNYSNNLLGSINLINLSIKYHIKRFVFTSSIAVYGSNQAPFNEKTIPTPEDPYGISKYAVELDLKAAYELFNLKYSIFRPHNVYGERQNIFDPFRNVIGIFMKCLLENKPMPVFGDGSQKRAFTYINDVAFYIANCINLKDTENEVFNIGHDTPYSIIDLAHLVAKTMKVKAKIIFLPERKEVKYAFADHQKLKKVFNIKYTVPLEKGLNNMVQWLKKIKVKKISNLLTLEIPYNLPSSWKPYFFKSNKK